MTTQQVIEMERLQDRQESAFLYGRSLPGTDADRLQALEATYFKMLGSESQSYGEELTK